MGINKSAAAHIGKVAIHGLVCAAFFSSGLIYAEKVKILLMGDTQYVLNTNPQHGDPEIFLETMQNITTDPVTKDAAFLIHMGDVIETGRGNDIPSSYVLARQGFDALHAGGMPYVLNFGNNDNIDAYNNAFPLDDYASWPSFVDHFDEHLNAVHQFQAGGVDWLVLSIRFKADGNAGLTAWAEDLIQAHPNKKLILVAHDQYMSSSDVGEMAREYPNTVLLLAGHNASHIELKEGKDGQPIGYIRTCWHHKNLDSYLCIVEFDTIKGTMDGRYYSPYWKNFGDEPASHLYQSPKNPSGSEKKNSYNHPWTWGGFEFPPAGNAKQ